MTASNAPETPLPPAAAEVGVPRRAWLIVALLAAASALNYLDRNIVAVLKPVLKSEFALTDGLASKKWTWIQAAVMSFFVGWFSKATGER